MTNQWVNSYKRLVPGYEAPVYVTWARRNRSDLIRVPEYKPGKEMATRIEYRSPDAACNPYLAFSVMLAAGLAGIEHEYPLPEPTEENVFEMTEAERKQRGIDLLPGSLHEAIAGGGGERPGPRMPGRPRLREPDQEQEDRVGGVPRPRHATSSGSATSLCSSGYPLCAGKRTARRTRGVPLDHCVLSERLLRTVVRLPALGVREAIGEAAVVRSVDVVLQLAFGNQFHRWPIQPMRSK